MNSRKVIELKRLCSELDLVQSTLKKEKEDFEKENEMLFSSKKILQDKIEQIKKNLSPEAIDHYKATGEKKMLGGIGIRVSKILEYDKREALSFCKKKDLFITLDTKAFEKAAISMDLDFVIIKEKETVTFPKVIKIEGADE